MNAQNRKVCFPPGENGAKYRETHSASLSQRQAWQQVIAVPSDNTALERNQPGKTPVASVCYGQVIYKFKLRGKKIESNFQVPFLKVKKKRFVVKEPTQRTAPSCARKIQPTHYGKFKYFCCACCLQCLFVFLIT